MAGTPEWCALPDGPVKLAALYGAARHWALRLETSQQAQSDASRDVSAAADWAAIAREIHNHSARYIRREAS
jgi:hypothetical protein